MRFFEQYSLTYLNTLRLPCTARYVAEANSISDLSAIIKSVTAQRLPRLVLGGGSNLILPQLLEALVIRPNLKGVRLLVQQGNEVVIEAMAGEVWHDFVLQTLAQGWYGLENLALIPGSVGAAPVQNIGAYGVEVADRMHSLLAMDRDGQVHEIWPADCGFAYRDSVFKQHPDDWIIVAVRFRLSLVPRLVLGYGDVIKAAGARPTPESVARAIIHIRQAKLPDPARIANAGSFFKNPCISIADFQQLKTQFPDMVGYTQPHDQTKLAAGWLIEQAGWRGKRLPAGDQVGPVGMYAKQALVLVNYANATADDVLALSAAVQADVKAKFGVNLEREPVYPMG